MLRDAHAPRRMRAGANVRNCHFRMLALGLGLLAASSFREAAADQFDAPEHPRMAAATVGGGSPPAEHPLAPVLRIANASLQTMNEIRDYQATFTKREVVAGAMQTQNMLIKLREKPFSVYLKYGGAAEGREILFVQGENNNQLLAHEGSGLKSLVGTVSLTTNSETAMAENRYPITNIGMRNFLELTIRQWEKESSYGESEVQYYPDAKVGGRPCQAIETSHPRPRRQFLFHMSRLYIDKETNLPVRIENYGFPQRPGPPPLLEEYTYTNIRTNCGLTNADFDRRNPNYGF